METTKLKKFAQLARRMLREQVSAKLKFVLIENSAARREGAEAIKKLEEAIERYDKDQVIERVAYTWFNRFCALRFMDVNCYTRIGVVSPSKEQFQPEILAEAKMGHIDEQMVPDMVRKNIFALLEGRSPSRDPQGEAYRLLIVAACNFFHRSMPFLFQRIDDFTELLMPDDLLSSNSILTYTREAMTSDNCKDVEIIGWLYQYYISEKKDEVFEGLKKNKKVTPENIPAATQLFTPHWIVRYLVENSLGRLWLLNRPDSKLVERMDYYIKSEQQETDFLKIDKPEDIKICDPACGSGHMLTYAFDLLYTIYEEEGYEPTEIPEKILTHNLFGIEIDERAGELAAFALTMKARAKQRRFFNKGVKPNICVLENVHFEEGELNDYIDYVGQEIFTPPLLTTLSQFEESDNFGSLIRPEMTEVKGLLESLETKDLGGDWIYKTTHKKILQALQQADYLSPKYHVVIANPPYMGGKGMNGRLTAWAKDNFPNSKSDLFAMFIERGMGLVHRYGYSAMVTMQSWMFLSSYEALRIKLMDLTAIESMAHMANMVMGIAFGTAATVWKVGGYTNTIGSYCYVEYEDLGEENKPKVFPPHNERNQKASPQRWFYRASASDFKKIPGSPIAYWTTKSVLRAFDSFPQINEVCEPKSGLSTTDNNRFLRFWYEVNFNGIPFEITDISETVDANYRWYPFSKGGDYRKWEGNREYVVNWWHNGVEIRDATRDAAGGRVVSPEFYFKRGITWSGISSSKPSMRAIQNLIFGSGGKGLFTDGKDNFYLGFLNSKIALYCLGLLSPTLNYEAGHIGSLPITHSSDAKDKCDMNIPRLTYLSKYDWDSYETSWDFTRQPLLQPEYSQPTLKATYQKLHTHWREMTLEMQRLEEENNCIFIEAYGLQDELRPEVPLNEITLTCNPHYRYGNDKSEEELEALLLADTMRELVSYAVGCMFGRYALDTPALILANQGETIEDYLKRVPEPSFPADEDNVIPILDSNWFSDDITERFRKFLRVAFGEEQYEENLRFIEQGLNVKDKRNYSIRDYFLNEFYSDHVKRYKKRPIYWLFSSPNGSFNALIYMHRYRPDTVSVVLNDYLREYRTKLIAHKKYLEAVSISASTSKNEKTKAFKEIDKTNKILKELEEYERDILYPLAAEQLEIDLDDGVKVNYPKFGAALKKIKGLTDE
ncbi:BREX-1 system adenine-specific DNA-methyltransferase PglX [Legionella pneumophila]|uniref:site-specific DNA-methyltransferase (adenine-specific) n=1 Tax=Legionella pneumophila subsp. pascullei TaxID=91890 RepID=A0AAX2IZS7_LEGPN|nr:BREX-1 system adenine-specific DNA-methyltransferase PglX [Legionella pneumophila]AMP93471.1 type II restriction endonuclease [Legionella pneumophila subsp. pascullei]SQG91417.1 Type I restriction-modification system methyltransferase subunit [Legionella pneumophila subsp. pascullei]VEH07963.1 Type I restriction-modification system methyltransferase subunit [Legionella pneumophila subsp. pascullei]HAU3861595.1 BREX-1 system adenine-specific DNA-methyltransferase PglX [Legionella pneumophila]